MCGGGGGYDYAGEERKRLERESDINRNIAQINKIFGVTDPDAYSQLGAKTYVDGQTMAIPDAQSYYEKKIEAMRPTQTYAPGSYEEQEAYQANPRLRRYERELAALPQQEDWSPTLSEAEQNAASRAGTLGQIETDMMDKFRRSLDEQRDAAERAQKINIARRGMQTGSEETLANEMLKKRYTEQLSDLTSQASGIRQNIESGDKTTMSNLIEQLRAGGDVGTASSSAKASLDSAASRAGDLSQKVNLNDLFASIEKMYGQQDYLAGYEEGKTSQSGGVSTPGTTSASTKPIVSRY